MQINYGRWVGKTHAKYYEIKFKHMLDPDIIFHVWSKNGDCCLINVDTMTEKEFNEILRGYR